MRTLSIALSISVVGLSSGCSLIGVEQIACQVDSDCGAFGASRCLSSGFCSQPGGPCNVSSDCHATLGFGFSCSAANKCEALQLPQRCQTVAPEPGRLLEPGEFSNAVVFGSIADRNDDWQQRNHDSQRLAILQANRNGGLSADRPFGMIFCDTAKNDTYDSLPRTDAAIQVSKFLAEEVGVPVITGSGASTDFQEIYDALVTMRSDVPEEEEVLLVSASATSPFLTDLDNPMATDENPGFFWRTAPPDSLQAVTMSDDMRARSIDRVVIIHERGPYGEGLQSAFSSRFNDAGGTVVASFQFDDESQRAEQIANAAKENFDEVLFVAQSPDVIAFLNTVESLSGFAGKSIFLPDAAAGADTLAISKPNVFARIRGTRPASPTGPVFDAFLSAFNGEFGIDPTNSVFVTNAYDAAWLSVYGAVWSAAQREGSVFAKDVGRGLRKISSGSAIEIRGSTLANIRRNFQSGTSINVIGASGNLDYDPVTEETTAPIEVYVIAPDCSGSSNNVFGVVNEGQDRPMCIP